MNAESASGAGEANETSAECGFYSQQPTLNSQLGLPLLREALDF
jgi:hypothetical protein